MPRCVSCSAPLPAGTNKCSYCGTVNDTDLQGINRYTTEKPESDRICPSCSKPMKTIDLKIDGKFYIERCEKCMGIFFDPGELEALLEKKVTNVFTIDHQRLEELKVDFYKNRSPIQYRKCPVCREVMQRLNYEEYSGVIIDRCRNHGVWLDGGELKNIMLWKKAGGELLAHNKNAEKEKMVASKIHQKHNTPVYTSADYALSTLKGHNRHSYDGDDDILKSVANFIGKYFG